MGIQELFLLVFILTVQGTQAMAASHKGKDCLFLLSLAPSRSTVNPLQVLMLNVWLVKPSPKLFLTLKNYLGIFDLTSNNVVSARTGGPSFIKTETSFGLMVYGEKVLSTVRLSYCAAQKFQEIY